MFDAAKALGALAFLLFAASCAEGASLPYTDLTSFPASELCSEAGPTGQNLTPEIVEDSALEPEGDGFEIAEILLTTAAGNIAKAARSVEDCDKTLASGAEQFVDLITRKRQSFSTIGGSRLSRDPAIKEIQQRIILLWRQDQAARGVYVALQTTDRAGSAYWAERLSAAHTVRMDESSRRYLEEVMQSYDWVDRKRFGKTVSDHAWLLVQHSDDRPEFQAMALSRMEKYLKSGGIKKSNYAYLWDRVAVNTGRKQRYGTQPDWDCKNGKMKLMPLEDSAKVNALRAKMGLGTVEKSLKRMNQQTCHQG